MALGEDMGKSDYNDETLEMLLGQAYHHRRTTFSTLGNVRRAPSTGSQDLDRDSSY
jgi:hypothetical protein